MAESRLRNESCHDEPLHWLVMVLDLLPLPALLVRHGDSVPWSVNTAARTVGIVDNVDWTDAQDRPLPATASPLLRAAAGERLDGEECGWLSPEGELKRFLVYAALLPPQGGDELWSIVTFFDVTQLRASEAELRQEVEARDDLFAVAAHELRDPLASLQLSLQLMVQIATDEGDTPARELAEYIDISRRQSVRLGRLIANMLDLTRVRNRRLQLDLEAVDVCELVRDVVNAFYEKARAAGSELSIEAQGPLIAYVDRTKIEQIVGNLISNAIKYGEGQPISLRVYSDDGTAFVEVRDEGMGIASEDVQRIFERFRRAAGTHQRESLGLGLYIAKAFAEAHGGVIRVASEPGRGSTFTLELPRKRLPDRRDAV
jgi:signal transduction histidine kinase